MKSSACPETCRALWCAVWIRPRVQARSGCRCLRQAQSSLRFRAQIRSSSALGAVGASRPAAIEPSPSASSVAPTSHTNRETRAESVRDAARAPHTPRARFYSCSLRCIFIITTSEDEGVRGLIVHGLSR
ncbi:hypothetical protein OJAV_G00168040 [Oryzias javanicus]|uniref:Uncharacterized protein n=1 Tax=Oryzias javanicus TaxID=123683 RepID=A0A437CG73_ORYJA|nr:hypothetical protein OJAV_G00168040 [Oryzias javanicus]